MINDSKFITKTQSTSQVELTSGYSLSASNPSVTDFRIFLRPSNEPNLNLSNIILPGQWIKEVTVNACAQDICEDIFHVRSSI